MKKGVSIVLVLTALCFAIQNEAQAQNNDALRVLNSALDALGGEARLKSLSSIYIRAKGAEHRSADAQGFHPEKETNAPHEEKLAVFSDGKRLAYEYKTGRHDGTTRWRRIFFTDTRRVMADFTAKFAGASQIRFPSMERDRAARRIPHMILLEVSANREKVKFLGTQIFENREHEVLAVELPAAKTPLRLYFDKKTNLLSKYEFSVDFPALGETSAEYIFSDYQKHSDLKWFPTDHAIKINGKNWRTMAIEEVSANPFEAEKMFELPPELEGFITPAGTVKEIAPGVFLAYGIGGSYQPLFIEFKDFVLAVEAPAAHPFLEDTPLESLTDPDALAEEFIAKIKETVKNKPIKYIVPTHYHSDHAGGLRAFAGEGATVLTTPGNKNFFEKFAPGLKIEIFDKKRVVSDGKRSVELINAGANPHTEENIVVYLPKEKYIYQGDLFYYNGDMTFPPKDRLTIMPFFAEWLVKNNLSPARIYGFHSTTFATMEHIEQILEMKIKTKK